jgi:hypothetical protein
MVTHGNVPDPHETHGTIELMIGATNEIVDNLSKTRDKWGSTDRGLASLIDTLRVVFERFRSAAESGRLSDPASLELIGQAYDEVSIALHELCCADDPDTARERFAKTAQLTGRVSDLVI